MCTMCGVTGGLSLSVCAVLPRTQMGSMLHPLATPSPAPAKHAETIATNEGEQSSKDFSLDWTSLVLVPGD